MKAFVSLCIFIWASEAGTWENKQEHHKELELRLISPLSSIGRGPQFVPGVVGHETDIAPKMFPTALWATHG